MNILLEISARDGKVLRS